MWGFLSSMVFLSFPAFSSFFPLLCMFFFFFCLKKNFFFKVLGKWLVVDVWGEIFISLSFYVLVVLLMAVGSQGGFESSGQKLIFYVFSIGFVLCFSCSSMLFFFMFFELTLFPVFFLILGWGNQPERVSAGFFLVGYTLLGSFPFLMKIFFFQKILGVVSWFLGCGLSGYKGYFLGMSYVFFFSWFLGFFIKVPVYGLHTWLPKAHVEAPVEGSMVLAAVMLKVGIYGIFRLKMMKYFLKKEFLLLVSVWFFFGLVYTCFVCFRQVDLKSFIAYSSISHMMLCVLALLSSKSSSVVGSVFLSFSHGLVSSLLFLGVTVFYLKSGSRSCLLNSSKISFSKLMSMFWFFACAANCSIPLSLGLFSEVVLGGQILSAFSLWSGFALVLYLFLVGCFSMVLYMVMVYSKFFKLKTKLKKKMFSQVFIFFFLSGMKFSVFLMCGKV